MAEYVYGIVEPTAPLPARSGIAGRPLRTVESTGAAALVSSIEPDELRLGREEVMAHNDVLRVALDGGPVLPMRLGTVMADSADVRHRLLEAHGDTLRDQLKRLAGTFEAEVRAVYDESALMREVLERDRDVAGLRAGASGYLERIQLGEAIAASVERIRNEDAEAIVTELAPHCLDIRVGTPGHERVALKAAFLLDRTGATAFDQTLEAIAERNAGRLHFRYTGPLAPHSFVELGEAV